MNQGQRRKVAYVEAGEILRAIVSVGWHSETLADEYGDDEVMKIARELEEIGAMLIRRGEK